MALAPGTRLGVYEIAAQIGVGGMGEVYRATDTKLKRQVAIKILPPSLAADRDRIARFHREAEVLASLNHPNIAAIFGLEDADGVKALVMELVEGSTLADRIAHGAIAIDEALPIARQIAEALESAHEHGIIHRDLKPANIKVRADGTVKVLDFGLAKAMEPVGAASPSVSMSPTITTPAMTQAGTILGTAAYMSPEQAKGGAVDRRSDVWAFGAVLFEMVTGKRAFQGKDVFDTLVGVLRDEPNWSAFPRGSERVVGVLKRCLEKDPKQRLRDVADARMLLDEVVAAPTPAVIAVPPPSRASAGQRLTALAIGLTVGGATVGTAVWLKTGPSPPAVARLMITPPGAAALTISGFDRDVAISPDGTRLVYVGGNGSQLFARPLDRMEPTPLGGLGVPHHPFFSPDGAWVGFFDGLDALKKVSVNGGPAVTVCRVPSAARGATWGPDGTIVFALQGTPGLLQVAANGGDPEVLTTPDAQEGEAFHYWPEFLPGGDAVVFTIGLADGRSEIAVLDLRTRRRKVLVRDGLHARYLPTGHLAYEVNGTLRAVPIDLARLELADTPIPLVEPILVTSGGVVDFDVSRTGTLVYVPASAQVTGRTLVWVDRQGHEEPIRAPVRAYTYPRLSPDGTRVALDVRDQENDIWIWHLARETLTRFTFGPGLDMYPVWTPEGRRPAFTSGSSGDQARLFWRAADGAGTGEELTNGPNRQSAYAISPDGMQLVFREDALKTGQDLMMLALDKERRVRPLVQTPFNELNAEVSPDGRWLAYESNKSGPYEIYVRPFPDPTGGRWQISTGGGTRPLWARNGQELFYLAPGGALMVAEVERGATFTASTPAKLFEGRYYVGSASNAGRTYDISPDGRRFLMMKLDAGTPASLVVVLNWVEELKRLVPRE